MTPMGTKSTKGPKGGYRIVPEWWRREVRDALDAMGRGSRTRLAEHAGCRTSAITQLLSDKEDSPDTSRIAARVAEFTGIPLPDEVASNEEEGESISEIKRLATVAPELLPHARQLMRSMRLAAEAAKKQPK